MHNKWIIYEMEKQRIQRKNLPALEYEKAVIELIEKLKI